MDGLSLLHELRQLLNEAQTATWPDLKTSYDLLYKAAVATVDRTGLMTAEETIDTVVGQNNYALSPNFLRLYLTDDQNRFFLKFYDGTAYYWLYFDAFDNIYLANQTTSVSIPNRFTIKSGTAISQLTGTTTSAGALASSYQMFGQTGGETTLTNSTATFTNVRIGDEVHNTTDGSRGIVVALGTTTSIICALFGGTNNYFSSGDSYIINPQARLEVYLDPPPSVANYDIIIPYVVKPNPIYSAYRTYSMLSGFSSALCNYAAWIYKYRDREASFGDAFYRNWDMQVRSYARNINLALRRTDFGVNMVRRASQSWTYKKP